MFHFFEYFMLASYINIIVIKTKQKHLLSY